MHVQVVLNNLYKYTALQMRFPVNAVALVNGTPQTLSLKEFLVNFLDFRREVVKRRARHGTTPPIMSCWCGLLSTNVLMSMRGMLVKYITKLV